MTNTNTHGGKRPGSGRKPSADQPRNITRSVKLTADEAEYISEVGTGELWRLLQASKRFKDWRRAKNT